MGELRHLLLVWLSRESKLLLLVVVVVVVVVRGRAATIVIVVGVVVVATAATIAATATAAAAAPQATQLPVVTSAPSSGRAAWGGRRVLITDGRRVGGSLVAGAVDARAEGRAGVAVRDARRIRHSGRRHLHRRRRLPSPTHTAQFE